MIPFAVFSYISITAGVYQFLPNMPPDLQLHCLFIHISNMDCANIAAEVVSIYDFYLISCGMGKYTTSRCWIKIAQPSSITTGAMLIFNSLLKPYLQCTFIPSASVKRECWVKDRGKAGRSLARELEEVTIFVSFVFFVVRQQTFYGLLIQCRKLEWARNQTHHGRRLATC